MSLLRKRIERLEVETSKKAIRPLLYRMTADEANELRGGSRTVCKRYGIDPADVDFGRVRHAFLQGLTYVPQHLGPGATLLRSGDLLVNL